MKKIRLDGVVGYDLMAEDIAEQINGEQELEVTINSPGGVISEGLSIYNLFHEHPFKITMKIDLAASIASVFALAGDEIVMKKNASIYMIHEAWTGAVGTARDLRKTADDLEFHQDRILGIYMDKTGLDRETILSYVEAETYMDAEQAFELGFIDKVVDGQVDRESILKNLALAKDTVTYDMVAMINKLDSFQNNIKNLSDAEEKARSFGLSRRQSTELVSSIKNIVKKEFEEADKQASNEDQNELINILQDFAKRMSSK